MKRVRTRFGAALAAMTVGASALVVMGGPAHALSNPPSPQLTYTTQIPSHPWPTGSLTGVNANDVEGLVSVPVNNSIWVADDNRDRMYEINATTGGLKSQILANAFQTTATQVGSGQLCSDPAQLDPSITDGVGTPIDTAAFECLSRTDDFESLVYDPTADVLYLTSGGCCTGGLPTGYPKHPTVWELTRSGSTFVPSRWQALPETEDPTAAGWRPGTGMYYGKNNFVRTYDFATNALGSKITAPSYLVGIDFVDASSVFLTTATPNPSAGRTTATSDSTITKYTFSGSSFTAVPGWTFPLKNTGVIDARDMALVGDTFYVSDGYDFRDGTEFNSSGVVGDHLIYEYALGSAPVLTAGFASAQQTTSAPYTVQFLDTTTPPPPVIPPSPVTTSTFTSPARTWAWDFDGNGTTDSTLQNPVAGFGATGTYSVKLTVTNAAGPSTVTKQVKVVPGVVPPGPRWNYESLNGNGSGVTNRHFGGGNTLLKYGTQLHGFYRDTTNSSLAHSWFDGTRWNTETLDGTGSTTPGHTNNSVGTNVASIVYNGQPQLFYGDTTTGKLRHAWFDGARWNFEAFDTKSAGSGSIAVRQYGTQLNLFYANDTDHRLRHAWYSGGWNFETLDTAATPSGLTSIDASKYGATLQVVFKTSGNALRHGWYSGGWNFETLDGSGSTTAGHTSNNVGDFATLQSFGNQLDILYRDSSANGLRHSWWNGTRWSFEQLDGNGGIIPGHTNNSVGSYIVATQYANGLHTWYRDLTSGALRHAWYAGGWHVEILDGTGASNAGASNSGNTGLFTSLVDYSGQLQLTYFDAGNSDRYAHTWYS